MTKLHEIVAIAKGVKSRVYGEVQSLHKEAQKAEPYTGQNKVYRAKDDDGEKFPPESKRVRLNAEDVLKKVAKLQTEQFDTEATKDASNCLAFADLTVDGHILFPKAPVTFLLFLEKQLVDMRTFVDKMPTLDEAEDWTLDPNTGVFRSNLSTTHKTKKIEKALVLYEATKDHPAQTKTVTEDVVIGWWDTIKHSGALPAPRKEALLERIDKLLKATKRAREQANNIDATEKEVGGAVFGYLFGV